MTIILDILSRSIVENESTEAWMSILDGLKSRGARNIPFLCSDNLKCQDKIKDIKNIYQSSNEELAREAFERFKQYCQGKYEQAVVSWENNWEILAAFMAFLTEIRKLTCTTNNIESFNASLRKYSKKKRVFPSETTKNLFM